MGSSPIWWWPYKKGEISRQRQAYIKGRRCEHTGRRRPCDWSDASTSQGMWGPPANTSSWKRQRRILPWSLQSERALLTHFQHTELWDSVSLVLSHPACSILLWQPLETNIEIKPEADTLCFLSCRAHRHTFAQLPFKSTWSCTGAMGMQKERRSWKDTQSSHGLSRSAPQAPCEQMGIPHTACSG